MSLRSDGVHRCDKCGASVGNGGVDRAAIICDLDPDQPGDLRYLHLCRQPREGAPRGCVGNVFGDAALASYKRAKESGKA